MLAMPPRAPLTGSFSVNEENNVVVCPLRNHDGSACRKRCTGVSLPSRRRCIPHVMPGACRRWEASSHRGAQEKRYRSMQEHIRRAHPEHYISKLPATEESFTLMINTPPQERPPPALPSSSAGPQGWCPRLSDSIGD
jgi:hypothetical protein